jgi:hypothetical protein
MSDFENDLQRLTFLKRTITLLSSMVDSGECHTTRSKEMKNNAQQVILDMEANVVQTSASNCNIPLVSFSEERAEVCEVDGCDLRPYGDLKVCKYHFLEQIDKQT